MLYTVILNYIKKESGTGLSSSAIWAIVGVVLGVVFVAAVIVAFVWYKYKKTQARLRYEMNDVRNVAGIGRESKMTDRGADEEHKPVKFEELQEEDS